MASDGEEEKKGLSLARLSFGGIIGFAGLLASGVATYNSVQNDIAVMKQEKVHQERTNERLEKKIDANGLEQRETMREFNIKLDRIIENWPRGRGH